MRVGSVLFVLILALVVLGFLCSDDIHVRREMQSAQDQIGQMKNEQEQLLTQLNKVGQDIQTLKSNINELKNQLIVSCIAQPNASGLAISQTSFSKIVVSAAFLFLPTLAIGLHAIIKYLRRKKNYILLTDSEIQQIIHQRRGQCM